MTTIRDIARIAGVSITTVSRALNGYSDVSEQTKRKIKEIAEDMNYLPNAMARSLVSNKTFTIGVILSELKPEDAKGNIAFETLCGINDMSSERGYDILLFSTNPTEQRKKSYYDLCTERNVDGAIVMGLRVDDPYLEEVIEKSSFPCVLIDIPYSHENLGNVSTDNIGGARTAVEHLIELGHTNIAMINGHLQADVSKKRLQGYKEALGKAGILFDASRVINGEYTEDGGKQAMQSILMEAPGVTAVFCASDLMALGAMKALEEMGRKVPESVSIVGFDGIILSSYCRPQLTTIYQNQYKKGLESAKLLIDMLEGKDVNHNLTLENELIIRESTKKMSLN